MTTTVFLLLCGAMTLLAVGLIAWPLLRPRIQADLEAGEATPARVTAVAVALLVPLAAAGVYLQVSTWVWDPEERAAAAGPSPVAMVRQLEERLQRQQGDVAGWMMLGRSYLVLGDPAKAVAAYERAYTLTSGRDPEAVMAYAESLAMADEAALDGRAAALFEQAHELAPTHPKALWYSGMVAYRRGDLRTARDRWAALAAQDPPAEVKQLLETKVAELDAALAGVSPHGQVPAS